MHDESPRQAVMGFRHTEKGCRDVLASTRRCERLCLFTPAPDDQSSALKELLYSADDPTTGRILASVKGRYYVCRRATSGQDRGSGRGREGKEAMPVRSKPHRPSETPYKAPTPLPRGWSG